MAVQRRERRREGEATWSGAAASAILRRSLLLGLLGLLGLASLGAAGGCRGRVTGLRPPPGTPAIDASHRDLYDGGITAAPVVLVGRAPGDVVDQRLFAQRLGHADLVLEVVVDEAWERRRGSRVEHFVGLGLGEVLLGELPKRSPERLDLAVESASPLEPALVGRRFLLFLRWAPGERPPYRHHLMIAEDEALALVQAMVAHAEEAGALAGKRGKRGKREKRAKRGRQGEARK